MDADRVGEAMVAVPRRRFLPAGQRWRASYDGPLPIGHGQTCSQPRTVADMLRLLDVHPGDTVLDVGSGSGWTTALLAHLTGPLGGVLGVELEPELVQMGRRHLGDTRPWARIEPARRGVLGAPEHQPYDRILVSAAAAELPAALVDQLAPGGRLVVPVAGELLLVTRAADGTLGRSAHGAYRFVPLR
jgi:protein-L-isoaspartate(D-aspartate) O-methyltransferase